MLPGKLKSHSWMLFEYGDRNRQLSFGLELTIYYCGQGIYQAEIMARDTGNGGLTMEEKMEGYGGAKKLLRETKESERTREKN